MVIEGGRTIDGRRQAITTQASRAVSAANTADIDGHGAHVATVVHTVGTGGAIATLDKTDVKPATSSGFSIASQARFPISPADSTDVNLATRARRRGGGGLGDVDGNTVALGLDQTRRTSIRETLNTSATGGIKSVTAGTLGHGTRDALAKIGGRERFNGAQDWGVARSTVVGIRTFNTAVGSAQ